MIIEFFHDKVYKEVSCQRTFDFSQTRTVMIIIICKIKLNLTITRRFLFVKRHILRSIYNNFNNIVPIPNMPTYTSAIRQFIPILNQVPENGWTFYLTHNWKEKYWLPIYKHTKCNISGKYITNNTNIILCTFIHTGKIYLHFHRNRF